MCGGGGGGETVLPFKSQEFLLPELIGALSTFDLTVFKGHFYGNAISMV